MTDTSIQDEPHPGASDSFRGDSVVDSHAGAVASPPAVRGADALSPVLSPTSPTSDTEHTTGTNNTNNFFSFRVRLFSRLSLYALVIGLRYQGAMLPLILRSFFTHDLFFTL